MTLGHKLSSKVYRSAVLSLTVQFAAWILGVASFFVKLPDEEAGDLQVILALELASQTIEGIWYTTVVCIFSEIVTWTRYVDWAVSTPLMLVSLAMFFSMRDGMAVESVFEEWELWLSLFCNAGMLVCGLAVELRHIPFIPGLTIGSILFVGSFTALGHMIGEIVSEVVFYVTYGVWALYGVAAFLPYEPKNIMYNGLDLLSKNVYGVFLFVYVVRRHWFA